MDSATVLVVNHFLIPSCPLCTRWITPSHTLARPRTRKRNPSPSLQGPKAKRRVHRYDDQDDALAAQRLEEKLAARTADGTAGDDEAAADLGDELSDLSELGPDEDDDDDDVEWASEDDDEFDEDGDDGDQGIVRLGASVFFLGFFFLL
jgi:hypothetical protein